jgi:hypothetical protein
VFGPQVPVLQQLTRGERVAFEMRDYLYTHLEDDLQMEALA